MINETNSTIAGRAIYAKVYPWLHHNERASQSKNETHKMVRVCLPMPASICATGLQLSNAFENVKIHKEPQTVVKIPAAKLTYQRPPRSKRTPFSQQKVHIRKAANVTGI